ncbi:MAG: hypothetical protein M3161_02885, partial [Actinomycetota bacterium]|nr:hypothetical protein [Actinomycetota bacterium]
LIQAAALSFVIVLVIGGVLVLAAKLNFPEIGGGGDFLGAINAIVIAGLGALGVPILLDGVAVAALPLGALAAIGWGMTWATRSIVGTVDAADVRRTALWGARVALPFGMLCWVAALVFRFRGAHPVSSDALAALLVGAFWGALFGALGTVGARVSLRAWARRAWHHYATRLAELRPALIGAAAALLALVALGVGAMLLWFIIGLARDAPGRYFDAGDAFAYLVYVIAFLPNIVIAVVSVAFGAPVVAGARVTLGGQVSETVREYSMWGWGGNDAPGVLMFLLLVPLLAGITGGIVARRYEPDRLRFAEVVGLLSAIVAVTLTLGAWIGRARLAGVVRSDGFGYVAVDVVLLFVLSFLAIGVTAALGWFLAERPEVARRLSWLRT